MRIKPSQETSLSQRLVPYRTNVGRIKVHSLILLLGLLMVILVVEIRVTEASALP